MSETTILKIDNFSLRIYKVVPNSDPSVVVIGLWKNDNFVDSIACTIEEVLLLSKTLIEHIIEPED